MDEAVINKTHEMILRYLEELFSILPDVILIILITCIIRYWIIDTIIDIFKK